MNLSKSILIIIWFSGILLGSSIGDVNIESQLYKECVISATNDCSFDQIKEPTLIYPGGNTRCAFNTDAGRQTNQTYRFQVNPGKGDKRKNVMIFFQGGGACVSDQTCSWSTQELLDGLIGWKTFETQSNPSDSGIFNLTHPLNPYRDWTIVHILYCTGDAHVGDHIANKDKDFPTYLNGANNTETVLKWTYQHIPKPNIVALAGCSAGSLGVQAWSTRILSFYKESVPSSRLSVIADSYPGYLPENQASVFKYFGSCNDRFDIPHFKEKCNSEEMRFPSLMQEVQSMHKKVPFAYLHSKNDKTQRRFYCLTKFKYSILDTASELNSCISQPEFYKGVKSVFHTYEENNKNVISYLLNGNQHCLLPYAPYYTAKAGNDSQTLLNWVSSITQDTAKSKIKSVCVPGNSTNLDYDCDSQITTAAYEGTDVKDDTSVPNRPKSGSTSLIPNLAIFGISIIIWIAY